MKTIFLRTGAVLTVAALLVCLGAVVARAGESRPAEQSVRGQDALIAETIDRWQRSFDPAELVGRPLAVLSDRLEPFARDTSTIYYGGTGNREVFYLIDDFVQIRVVVDLQDSILSSPVAEPAGLWLKDKDGSLLGRPYPKSNLGTP